MIEYLPDIPFNLTQGLSLCMVPAEIGFSGKIVAHLELFKLVGLLQSSTQPQQRQKRENKQTKIPNVQHNVWQASLQSLKD